MSGSMSSPVIPRPIEVEPSGGTGVIGDGLVIECSAELAPVARWFRRLLEGPTGWRIEIGEDRRDAGLRLAVGTGAKPAGAGPAGLRAPEEEAYELVVDAGAVSIVGGSPAGVFYGLQSLRQLMPAELWRSAPVERSPVPPVALGGVTIRDAPEYPWRGVLLDVSRHFMPKSFVLKLIDLMALHKLNVLHLHLTDDQGWRVEIDRYPRLTAVGAWRKESQLGRFEPGTGDGRPHGGFYSKDDLREIVAYAGERFVAVLPEIDMPGHMVAAIAAYPELGNTAERRQVMTDWGISDHVLRL
ncbi:MAG TPA: beta-N-acetylhexosaminidase, partial [Acidimicrobiales bacterium]|nr:beta-N-acetylhexosaminidase [Acidimicrobiales bacterium]